MASPALLAITNSETYIDVQFDQTVIAPSGRYGEGFTITVNGAVRIAVTASQPAVDKVRLTITGVIQGGDKVLVTYTNAYGNLVNGTAETAASFAATQTTNNSQHAALMSSVLAQNETDNNVITLSFDRPVTSVLGYGTGLTVKSNTATVVPTTVLQGSDPRTIKITFAGGFQYSDVLTWSYVSATGDWTSGYDYTDQTDVPVVNASRIGTPEDAYPLSSVIREQLTPVSSIVKATIVLDLNSIDYSIVTKFGPITVDFGGTFGVTVSNPAGITIAQDLVALKQGLKVTKDFYFATRPDWAAVAAAEWLTTVTNRISQALAAARTTDQAVVVGSRTVKLV
jgi:hypothetical protein